MSVQVYKEKLGGIVNTLGGITDTTNPLWNELNNLITQDVLNDAFSEGQKIHYTDIVGGCKLQTRTSKTMERINVKKAMTDRPDLGFKTNCDFMAYRLLNKDISKIPEMVDMIVDQNNGNPVYVRPQSFGPDIVQYMYVYHKDLGYLAEYQIGHPFAALKFKHDSMKRDGDQEAVDFKKATFKFYDRVKDMILKGEKVDIQALWKEAFPNNEFELTQDWIDCF